jgi:signal transduction histidine kinase
VAGAFLAIGSWLLLGLLTLLWGAAIYSLVTGPIGPWYLPVAYVLAVPAGLLALLWCVRRLAAVQRARFRRRLGITIEPPADSGWWLIRLWRTASTWRQLAYHLVALVAAVPASLSIVVPPAARRLAGADARLAGLLLGPGRAERLEQRVRTLTRSRTDIIEATDAERRRIERDLHDGTQQRLMSLALSLGMARSTVADGPART